jgi:glycine/sarcosine N-methyltransferase
MMNINDFDTEAEYYDLFEMKNQKLYDSFVDFLEKLFTKNGSRNVLDVTCGTGAQAIPLAKKGFKVLGSDIGQNMIRISKKKGEGVSNLSFKIGDVRKTKFGEFDAVISMLNSLGYLNKSDFEKALLNINSNLKMGGLLIFDNTNKTCLDSGNFTKAEIIDTAGELGIYKFVRFSKSKYDIKSGVIYTEWKTLVQNRFKEPIENNGVWKRQTYTAEELNKLLNKTGFVMEKVVDRSLKKFDKNTSFAYLIVAKKIKKINN